MPIFESTFDVKAIEVMKRVGSRYCMAFGLSFEMGFLHNSRFVHGVLIIISATKGNGGQETKPKEKQEIH